MVYPILLCEVMQILFTLIAQRMYCPVHVYTYRMQYNTSLRTVEYNMVWIDNIRLLR